ncbi:MAG: amino acid ABC transporter substrate-binding protein [Deltaproteobacteria bacterium]|nr:amino acid ABC transporter substrate-binding protein [Deltaproteobacteria bacterium]
MKLLGWAVSISKISSCLFIFMVLLCGPNPVLAQADLKVGWEPWAPYQYRDDKGRLTGLDIELISAISKKVNVKLEFKEISWKRHLVELEQGTMDIATSASKTAGREKFAFFSDPYRKETVTLFVRRGESGKYHFKTLSDLVGSNFRLGITSGYFYGKDFAQLMKNPNFVKHTEEASDDPGNYKKLLANRIDGFLSDQAVTAVGIRKEGLEGKIEIHPMYITSEDIFFMFSRKSVKPDMVGIFNTGLKALKASGSYDEIINKFLK